MLASAITTRAGKLLHDISGVRWSSADLLLWLNDGQKQVAIHRPDASVFNGAVALTAGNTKQSVPAAGVRLLSVNRNMGTGSTPGRPVTLVDRDILDAQLPDWHTDDAAAVIKHYVFDIKDPRTFFVYPRPLASVYVEMSHSVLPTDCASTSSTIGIPAIYSNALLDYIMYRALSADTEYADQPRADRHYNTFLQSLGLKLQVDRAIDPNVDKKTRG